MSIFIPAVCAIIAVAGSCARKDTNTVSRVAEDVRSITDAHTRVVWVQDTKELTDVFALGNELRLMGYDTDDGEGERVILPGPASFAKPMITRRGDRIIFSDLEQGNIHIVDWDGSNRREVAEGIALAVWIDPDNGTEWIYVGRERSDERGNPYESVIRMPIDDPGREEQVWSRTLTGVDNFQLSADGTRAAGLFPWPECGVLDLENRRINRYGRGCWTSYSPDNSYLFWYFDGSHRNVLIVNERTEERWEVNVNNAPAMKGHEVYHPRWSNHPSFITVTGPYKIRAGGNNIRGGGPGVEIFIGSFSEDFKNVDEWVQVTDNPYANFFPDVWVNPDDRPLPHIAYPGAVPHDEDSETEEARLEWPVITDNLLFIWDHRDAENEIPGRDGEPGRRTDAEPVGEARYGRNLDMDVRSGHFKAEDKEGAIAQAVRGSDAFSIEAVITPEGHSDEEAVIMSIGKLNDSPNAALIMRGGALEVLLKGAGDADQIFRSRSEEVQWSGQGHVLLSIRPGNFELYLNGSVISGGNIDDLDLSNWTSQSLYFGGQPADGNNWSGYIESVAIYGNALTREDALAKFESRKESWEERDDPSTVTVKARLTHASQIPTPEAIEPYQRGLVANEYKVIEVKEGELEDEEILVAHWVILDGQTLDTAERQVDEIHTMTIELYDDRKELEGERLSVDTDNILLRTFFDTGS